MRKALEKTSVFRDRRQRLGERIKNSVLILPSHPEMIRNNDVDHLYRADSNLYYMTGFEEPGSILVFRPGKKPETVLFVRPKDLERETWDGFRFGPDGAKSEFGVDEAYLIDDFEKKAPALLNEVDRVYYRLFAHPEWDAKVSKVLEAARRSQGRSGKGLLAIYDPTTEIGELRIFKSPYEVELQRKACQISAQGHMEIMKHVRPGMNEREVQGLFIYKTMQLGSAREGYPAIVAGGEGACVLHYRFNDQLLKDGDLLLVDAGAEYNFFTGDITRTFPINGKFTEPQRQVYEAVLDVQKKLIQMVRPGVAFQALREKSVELLAEAMLELGLFVGTVQKVVETEDYRKYYPHGFGHWLGMDVHDQGLYVVDGHSRVLEPGMCLTIEPGLYIPANDTSAPKEFRGIGIRIEDDVLVTAEGNELLTKDVVKEVADIEAIVGTER